MSLSKLQKVILSEAWVLFTGPIRSELNGSQCSQVSSICTSTEKVTPRGLPSSYSILCVPLPSRVWRFELRILHL